MLVADLVFVAVAVLIIAMIVTVAAHVFLRVPYVPTPWNVARKMVDFAELKGNETVYDLGAGDGRLLITAKRQYPGIWAIGCELAPTIWLWGKLRIWWSGQQIDFYMRNVLKQDLHDADCVFLYLLPSLMEKLGKKFDAELKPGTKVLSYAFQFKNRKPVQEQNVRWLKGERKLRMYMW